jgi:hypothetical protein
VKRLWTGILMIAAQYTVACGPGASGGSSAVCVPGTTQACVGVGACAGGQACTTDGSGYGACECGAPLDASTAVPDARAETDATLADGAMSPEADATPASDATLADDAASDAANDAPIDALAEASAHPLRCDDAGSCSCFNLVSLGYGGATGANFGSGTGGSANTQEFLAYLRGASSIGTAQVGCGTDTGCASSAKPTLDADFLSHYDVLLFQWMTNAQVQVLQNGTPVGLQGSGYWSFTPGELAALKTWVEGGGGVIVLSGYDDQSAEIGPANQVLGALTDIQYTATDTYGQTETGNAAFCLGDSDVVSGWAAAPDPIGESVSEVGAYNGRGIAAGANAVIDCTSAMYGVCAAHEDLGAGHVVVLTDEWVTYTSQWNPPTEPATYCSPDGSTANGDFPAVQSAYQVPQLWYNAIRYASQATRCPFTMTGTIPQ